ncbi:hypothetical protein L210DRAFT_960750 [Boletus edulis BED1]|uniref:PinX1-related protein 1 n=1 Tax=Boletus edulis BED1 TaxID=1328754 RepID=A0AAD4GGP1_BOLED|nr:hypothetical protein L210DRAFT_960750 [Boletus edulis BED1]
MSPSSYGYTYLTSYGWTGTGTGLRKGAIAKPLAIPPKKNLSGLGKDRDEAFPFWDHLFAAASKAITIKVSSDDEDADESKVTPFHTTSSFDSHRSQNHTDDPPTPLARTTTGILSNRRPVSGTPASTSGITTPRPDTDADRDVPDAGAEGRLSLLATAKREAAKRGLYARFFRGAVLGPDDDSCASHSVLLSCEASSVSTPVSERVGDQEDVRETDKSKKRKAEDRAETKEERRERKRLKRERKAAKAAKKAARGCKDKDKMDRKALKYQDEKTQSEENEASHIRKKTRKQAQKVVTSHGQDTLSHRPSSDMDATDVLNIVLTTKKKKAKRKDTLSLS